MLRNEKGITLASLAVTVIILIILASFATVSGITLHEYIKFKNAKAQFQTMQSHVNTWYEESKNNTDVLNYGESIESSDSIKREKMENELGIDLTSSTYKYFSSEYIQDTLDIDGISHSFLIDIKNRDILLFGGVKYEEKRYYTAKDFGIKNVEYDQMEGEITFDTSIEYEDNIAYMTISNINIPENIKKYEIKYTIGSRGYWTTLTDDIKDESGSWKFPVTVGKECNIEITTKSDEIVKGSFSKVIPTRIEWLIQNGDKLTEKLTLEDKNGDKITIPAKFSLAADSGKTVNEGIVVVAPDESEFVWVPVEDPSTMYGVDSNGNKLGKLYDLENLDDEGNPTKLNWTETSGVMSWISDSEIGTSFREPDYLSGAENGDASTVDGRGLSLLKSIVGIEGTIGTDNEKMLNTWKLQLQNSFDSMIESVEKYNGFYVGRYETSYRLDEDGTTKIAQSIGSVNSATSDMGSANSWYGLYQIEKEYSKRNSITAYVGSTMIWGTQYDQMMLWLENNGYDVRSADNLKARGLLFNETKVTGSQLNDKMNNIFDLLGNSWEWTMEATSDSERVCRGGGYNTTDDPPVLRDYYRPSSTDKPGSNDVEISSRITLYIK